VDVGAPPDVVARAAPDTVFLRTRLRHLLRRSLRAPEKPGRVAWPIGWSRCGARVRVAL